MSNIRILKNSPKLNSNGQYRFDGGGADAQNLSVSGEFNSKFLDDDLYTTFFLSFPLYYPKDLIQIVTIKVYFQISL